MDIINLIVKSCQHIVMCRANDMEPIAFGSGCIVVSMAENISLQDESFFIMNIDPM
jgi:hypothetical protein